MSRNNASPDQLSDDLIIHSPSLGELIVPRDAVVHFVTPLWGFPDEISYALLPAAREGLWWLMSTSEPFTTFVLADPFSALTDYVVELSEADREVLQLATPEAAMLLVILSIPLTTDQAVTANLRAPIICNLATRRALQVVSTNDQHSFNQPIGLSLYPLRDGESPAVN